MGAGQGLSDVMEHSLLGHSRASSLLVIKFEHKVEDLIAQNGRVTGVAWNYRGDLCSF
jgi:predicted oxidoreductase